MDGRLAMAWTAIGVLTLAPAQAQSPPPLIPSDVEAFLDGAIPLQMKRDDIAGATVAVVKDGALLFAKGYGYADVATKRRVSANETLFRPGSVSKLFTWTAVMQLVERGKLDLDRDVNEYLDFQIPATYSQPITLRHLMTHTAGFEEALKDLFVREPAMQSLRSYVIDHLPRRMYPPGATPAYSNYGCALAGYIVERVSGESFPDYMSAHILSPLGMDHSTFAQPLPEKLAKLMSSAYTAASARAGFFEFVPPSPAAGLSSTATDMARFMIAHLQDGRFENTRILLPETARLMHTRQSHWSPEISGATLGFVERSRNDHRIISHDGGTMYFRTVLRLVADSGVGFFLSYNSSSASARQMYALWELFLDRYYPPHPAPVRAWTASSDDARRVSGVYMMSRRSDHSFGMLYWIASEVRVSALPDGNIRAEDWITRQTKRWREVAPLLYREVDGEDHLLFARDSSGRLMLVPGGTMVFHRVAWWQDNRLHMAAAGYMIVVMALTLFSWPIAYLVRRHFGWPLKLSLREHRLRLAVRAICAFDLLMLTSCTALVMSAPQHMQILTKRLDPWLLLLNGIGLACAVATAVPALYASYLWRRRDTWWAPRLHETLIALACVAFTFLAVSWNFANLNVRY